MSKMKNVARVAVTAGLAFGLIAAGSSVAQAEPTAGAFRTYAAVGSDTIQDVYNGLSNGYTLAGAAAPSIASYDAFGTTATIQTKANGPVFTRPAGSGDGVKALSASYNPAKNVYTPAGASTATPSLQQGGPAVDIARSSSRPGTAVGGGSANDKLTFVPLARDAVSVAIKGTAVTNLTTLELHAIYFGGSAGNVTQVGTADPTYNGVTIQPELPQSSSGTRSFFLKAIGQVAGDVIGSWVTQAGDPENNASTLTSVGELAPFSAAQWIAQKNGIAPTTFVAGSTDDVKISSLNGATAVNGTGSALVAGGLYGNLGEEPSAAAGSFARDVYSVVPTARLATDTTFASLVKGLSTAAYGPAANRKSVVIDYGFGLLSYSANEGEYHSNFTN